MPLCPLPDYGVSGGQEMVPTAGSCYQGEWWLSALMFQTSRGPTDTNCSFISWITAAWCQSNIAKIIKQIFYRLYLQAAQQILSRLFFSPNPQTLEGRRIRWQPRLLTAQPAALLSKWNLLKLDINVNVHRRGWGQDNEDQWWGFSTRDCDCMCKGGTKVKYEPETRMSVTPLLRQFRSKHKGMIRWLCGIWLRARARATGIWIWLAKFPTLVTLRFLYHNIFLFTS